MRTKLQATPSRERIAAAVGGEPVEDRLARQLRRRSLALFVALAIAVAAGVVAVLRSVVDDRLATAAIIVGAALIVSGLYAALVDRAHARWALAAAAAVGGAIAAVDQLLAHFG